MAKDKERIIPPYIPWKTFTGYLDFLKKGAPIVPRRIDTSMMPTSMSGAMRSQLKSALRFLQLIEPDGTVNGSFAALIESYGNNDWKSTLHEVVRVAYAEIVPGVDLNQGTAGQLSEAFGKAGVDGEVRFKAVRFFLAALQSAGITFSPFFVARGAKTSGRKQSRKKAGRANGGDASLTIDDDDELDPAAEMTRWPIPIPGKRAAMIVVPTDITVADWTMINTVVQAFIAHANKAAQRTE